MPAKAKTLVVASNSTSGIEGADYVGTLTDGTVLGFRRSGSTIYFYQEELLYPHISLVYKDITPRSVY